MRHPLARSDRQDGGKEEKEEFAILHDFAMCGQFDHGLLLLSKVKVAASD